MISNPSDDDEEHDDDGLVDEKRPSRFASPVKAKPSLTDLSMFDRKSTATTPSKLNDEGSKLLDLVGFAQYFE